jgi:ABC-type glycerol-3-phosphate transport system permease component
MKGILKIFILLLFACFTLAIPIILLYVGMKPSGIDLKSVAATQGFSLNNFIDLFSGDLDYAKSFRQGLFLSILYSLFVGIGVMILTFASNLWVSSLSQKKAIGLTFFLLSLTLLPQTFLILMALKLTSIMPFINDEIIRIAIYLLISILPISIWFFYFFNNRKIRQLLTLFALDSLNSKKIFSLFLYELRIEFFIVITFITLLVWGNFLIPFSLGTANSFPALVYISSFTTNLGRDWALISAGSFVLLIPVLLTLIGLHYGYKKR